MAGLFDPLTIRGHTLKNRVVFGAHTTNMAEDGLPTERHVAYYEERARGGAGMIVVEPMPVHPAAVLTRGNFRHSDDHVIPAFQALTRACKPHGAVMIQQLYHVGAHGDWDNSWHANWSPSGGPSYHDEDGSHAMSGAEIEETIEGFVDAALRCQEASFDGVEVWAAYHCLLDQFWTPFSNQRTDEWGGSLENRTRFSREILRRIREACGEDFIVGLSVSDAPQIEAALDREATAEIVKLHDDEGLMDYVTVGSGSYFNFEALIPSFQHGEKLTTDLTATLKQTLTRSKVTSESHIRTPDIAATILGAGEADMVSIVRGQIADPHWANKAAEARADDIRGCLSCNQQCWGRRHRDYWISCVVNPSVGREREWGGDRFATAKTRKRVLVVGAGPAGLEAARAATERGHDVTLAEAAPDTGGQFRLAGLQPRRGQITDLLGWYDRQLAKLGVDVRLNTCLDADAVREMNVDALLVSTGAQPREDGFQKALPHIAVLPGRDGNVCTVEDVLARTKRPGKRVVLIDEAGDWRGIGTAWKLAEDGHDVTILTPDSMVGRFLHRSSTDIAARSRLKALGATFVTEHAVTRWGYGAEVQCLLTGATSHIAADTLVLSVGRRAETSLTADLAAADIPFTAIGDCLAPRNAAAAIYEGRKAALAL